MSRQRIGMPFHDQCRYHLNTCVNIEPRLTRTAAMQTGTPERTPTLAARRPARRPRRHPPRPPLTMSCSLSLILSDCLILLLTPLHCPPLITMSLHVILDLEMYYQLIVIPPRRRPHTALHPRTHWRLHRKPLRHAPCCQDYQT